MLLPFAFKNLHLVALLALPVLALLLPSNTARSTGNPPADQVNLALRRTADALLRASVDSTSRIPAIEQTTPHIWHIRLTQGFDYDQLPVLLQGSLDLYGIKEPYTVAIRRCIDGVIDLGYHYDDVKKSEPVSCTGREMPEGCHYIEVAFIVPARQSLLWPNIIRFFIFLSGVLFAFLLFRQKWQQPKPVADMGSDIEWLSFGQSRLDVANQVLIANGTTQQLTFREAKLLKLFATHPDHLLERDLILQQVWADEGILVGRSVDVFVSRLRKKLAPDSSISISAVHGVGYRLETNK